MSDRVTVPLAMIGVAVFWGVAFSGIKRLLVEVSPVTLTLLRFGIAAVCMLVIAAVWPAARPRFERRDVPSLVLLGALGVPVYHLAINWGEHHTSASIASLIVATAPVMVALLSAAVLRERVPPMRAIGIALAFGGVALLALAGPRSSGGGRTTLAGPLITLIAPASWAVYTIVAKPLMQRAPAARITIASNLLGCVLLLPLLNEQVIREARALSAGGWWWAIVLGTASSIGGYLLYLWVLGRVEASKAAVTLYLVPIVALAGARVLLDEPLGGALLPAAAIILSGIELTRRSALAERARS